MDNPLNLHQRVALVTGAGRGIGREIARTFARAGAAISVGDLDWELASRAAEEIQAQGGQSHPFSVEVRLPDSVEPMVHNDRRRVHPVVRRDWPEPLCDRQRRHNALLPARPI